jgi:nucleoside-diphosphate-sugar epimerase
MAAAAGVRRLVYLSTIGVNGRRTFSAPFTEKDIPDPKDPYAISKWESEQLLLKAGRETGLEIVVLRPPLVYGQGVGANFLKLLDFVQKGIPLPLASVSNRRSFIYVENLSDAILKCAMHPCASGRTYLVCDDESVSTPELIDHIAHFMRVPARTFPGPPRLLNLAGKLIGKSAELSRLLHSLVIDGEQIRSETGWAPPYTLSQGLKKTVDWYLTTREGREP